MIMNNLHRQKHPAYNYNKISILVHFLTTQMDSDHQFLYENAIKKV